MRTPNDVILRSVTKVAVFIIMTFSVHLFLAGHHNPGGGFIGGLVTASALVLLYMAFDIETARQIIPIDFKVMAGIGILMAVFTGVGSLLIDVPFLTQAYIYATIPFLGETELATSVIFDIGVSLAVIGTAMTIILSISEEVE